MLGISLVGCGAADDASSFEEGGETAAISFPLINAWTAPVSEEQPQGVTCGNDQAVAMGIWCTGSYCDSMRIFCGALPSHLTKTGSGVWTSYISEENGGFVACPTMHYIDGIRATGSYSDNISVHCASVPWPVQYYPTFADTPWLSEEQGARNFDADPWNPGLAMASTVTCSGSYCDAMRFRISEDGCTSNADCPSGTRCDASNTRKCQIIIE